MTETQLQTAVFNAIVESNQLYWYKIHENDPLVTKTFAENIFKLIKISLLEQGVTINEENN